MNAELQWFGDRVKRQVEAAAIRGVNQTMSEAVILAKNSHPGWKNRTGTAEGSIRIQSFAIATAREVFGLWGSVNVNYFIWLELKYGAALRHAADIVYPRLKRNISEAMGR